MAFNNKKKNANYISAKESRAIARENRKITQEIEKKRNRKHIPEEEYVTKMKNPENCVEFDNVQTYFFTDIGTVKSVDGVSFDVPQGKTVGIVGGGAIGRMVMQRLQGWDCKLIYSDPYRMPEEMEKKLNCEYVSLETLLRESDVVSLHCPLTEQTRGMIGKEQLAMMKPNAIIVNEARGAVIDDAALVEALRTGEIWGAALDVWEKEPLDPEDPLCKFEKVITTSHLGAATRETVIRCFSIGYNNILRAMNGEELVNRVNK